MDGVESVLPSSPRDLGFRLLALRPVVAVQVLSRV